jgi:AAA domain/Bifunctional DNA primase/polymerase, N-terminal
MTKENDARNLLLSQGCVLVPLRSNEKRPLHESWSTTHYKPADVEGFVNVGINHVLSETLCLDVDDVKAAAPFFKFLGLSLDDFPGRYTASKNRWKCLFRKSPGMIATRRDLVLIDPNGVMSHPFEIRGNGQDVLFGSRHPDGGDYLFRNGGLPEELPELPEQLQQVYNNWNGVMPSLVQDVYGFPWKPGTKDKTGEELTGNRAAIVARFNEKYTIEDVLLRLSYVHCGGDRWLWPGSTTGAPGVVVYDDGTCYSNHQTGDPLADQRSHDAFDVTRICKYQGDWDKALEFAAEVTKTTPEALAASDFAEFEGQPVPKSEARQRWGFAHIKTLGLAPPAWLIKGVLEDNATAIWYGDPASYKTFTVLDMAMHIATGKSWQGKIIKRQGPVAYVAGEGNNGFGRRIAAWCKYHETDVEEVPLYKSVGATSFSAPAMIQALMDGLSEDMPAPVLLVIDTMARNLGGDENSNEDVNRLFHTLDRIRLRIPELAVLIVGHPGLGDPNRPRGASGQTGNVDAQARVVSRGELFTEVTCQKMKDADRFETIGLELAIVPLGLDEEGDEYSSLVVVPGDGRATLTEEASAGDRVLRLRWVILDACREGHVGRPRMAEIAAERGVSFNNNEYRQFLRQMQIDGLIDLSESSRITVTNQGFAWLERNSDAIWS